MDLYFKTRPWLHIWRDTGIHRKISKYVFKINLTVFSLYVAKPLTDQKSTIPHRLTAYPKRINNHNTVFKTNYDYYNSILKRMLEVKSTLIKNFAAQDFLWVGLRS